MPRGSGGVVFGRPEFYGIKGVTISATPTSGLLVGATFSFQYTPIYTSKGKRQPTLAPQWTSSDTGVATIDAATGEATGVAAGTTTITVRLDGHSATYVLAVADTPSVPFSITVLQGLTASPITVSTDSPNIQLTAQTKDQFGANFTDTHTWETSNGSLATVNGSGLVDILAQGTVTITARSVTDNTKTGTFQIVITATVLTPTTVEIAGSALRTTTVGAAGTLTAIVKDQNGDTMPGLVVAWTSDNADVSINSSSGAWSADGQGGATITATYAGVDPDLTDTVIFTVNAAPSAGQLESPTGRRPQYGWRLEWQWRWKTKFQDTNHWWYQEQIVNSNSGNDNVGSSSAWLYQLTGNVTYAARAYTKLAATLAPSIDDFTTWVGAGGAENDYREYLSLCVHVADVIYPALTSEQRTYINTGLNKWKEACFCIGTAKYQGGWKKSDSDAATGAALGLMMLHYWDVPENTNYLNVWNQVMYANSNPGGFTPYMPMGGVDPVTGLPLPQTAADFETARNALYLIMTQGSIGGAWMEGTGYNGGTITLLCHGIGCLRTSGDNGASNGSGHDLSAVFPEFDAWLDSFCEKNFAQYSPDLLTNDKFGDNQAQNLRTLDPYREWKAMTCAAGLGVGTTYGPRQQRLCLDFYAVHSTTIQTGTSHHLHQRGLWFWDPDATADAELPNDSAFSWTFAGDDTTKVYGVGHLVGKDTNRLVSLRGGNKRMTDHGYQGWCDTMLYRNGKHLINHVIGYSTALWTARHDNTILLAGLGAMLKLRGEGTTGRGVLRTVTGTAGGNPWGSMHSETHGQYYLDKSDNYNIDRVPIFVTKAERRQTWLLMPNDIDVVVNWDDFDVQDPRGMTGYSYFETPHKTLISNHFALTGGCAKLLNFGARVTPTYDSAGAHPFDSWTDGSYTIELHYLYWGSGGTTLAQLGRTVVSALSITGNTGVPSETDTEQCIRIWSNGAVTAAEKYVTVWVVRPTAQATPALALSGGNPDIVTCGARTITQSASGPYTAVT